MTRNKAILLSFVIFSFVLCYGQNPEPAHEPKTVFSFQLSPVFSLNLIQNNDRLVEIDSLNTLELRHMPSYLFGMEMRHEVSRYFSIQTGINNIRRHIDMTLTNDSVSTTRLKYYGYEIPVMLLAYLRLSEHIYMDNAVGVSVNFYPSDIIQGQFYGISRRWISAGLLAHVGWDFRTQSSGYFHIGASYQLHFGELLHVLYFKNEIYGHGDARIVTGGSYLAVNFKYFFPVNAKRK
jgi:hypothetical protein